MIKKAIKRRSNTPKLEEYTWGGAISGLSTGASLGASIGSVIPGIGTVVGGIVGGVAGAIGGVITSDQDAADEALSKKKATNELENANYYSNTSSRNQMGITTKVAYGGMIPPNAEAEGGEVLKTPDGQVDTLQGPSHAQGGIPIIAPQGTKVYSDRLKHNLYGKKETYADSAARLNRLLDKYKKTDEGEDFIKRGSDALMIARIQRQLDALFQAQELDKEERGIKPVQDSSSSNEQLVADNTNQPTEQSDTPEFKSGGWIQHAINPAHKGYCTPMTKSTCTPHRKALAMRFKHGDLHKHAYGGTTGYDNPDELLKKKYYNFGESMSTDTNANPVDSTYDINWQKSNWKKKDVDYMTPIKSKDIQIPQTTDINNYNISKAPEHNDVTGLSQPIKDKNLGVAEDVIGTVAEAAPMIHNMFQPKPDKMSTAEYMNTKMFNPKRMDTTNDIREAERTYSAIINDQSLSPQQRMLASRQLQAVKGQILQQANNMYKQDMNRAEELNANIRQQNIETAMKIKDTNDANVAAYANSKSQAAGDLSQMIQKRRLEMNMRKSNDMQMNAVKSAFPDIEFKKDGTMSKKGGTALTSAEIEEINKLIYTMTYLNQYNTGSYQGYNNNGYINSANYDLQQGNK